VAKIPYTYVDKKVEDLDEMILYAAGDKINLDTMVAFCRQQKQTFNDGAFHIVVFFNKKENARFPNNPITAMYIEDSDLKNIKADYTYNKINGYSKLTLYDKNAFESKQNEITIE
jgi:hypothetical protein